MRLANFKTVIASLVLLLAFTSCINTHPQSNLKTFEWQISTPEEQEMDSVMLSKVHQRIQENYSNVLSLLVVKNGKLVYEKYYQGKTSTDYTHVYSVTKSVMSALIGIAITEGFIHNVDQGISEFLPEEFSKTGQDKKQITIKNALTMTGGLKPVDENILPWIESEDWFQYTISQPMVSKLGTKFDYNTGLTHLLSGVLTKAAKMDTLDFANKYLFMPMGITNLRWEKDPKGYYGGGHLLFLTPRDMAKFGYLYLKNGNWMGTQIVPEGWVRESLKKQISTGAGADYGYLWWLSNKEDRASKKSYFTISALGLGGQRIDIIPDLNMVVVITANPDLIANDGADTGELLSDYILPSVIK